MMTQAAGPAIIATGGPAGILLSASRRLLVHAALAYRHQQHQGGLVSHHYTSYSASASTTVGALPTAASGRYFSSTDTAWASAGAASPSWAAAAGRIAPLPPLPSSTLNHAVLRTGASGACSTFGSRSFNAVATAPSQTLVSEAEDQAQRRGLQMQASAESHEKQKQEQRDQNQESSGSSGFGGGGMFGAPWWYIMSIILFILNGPAVTIGAYVALANYKASAPYLETVPYTLRLHVAGTGDDGDDEYLAKRSKTQFAEFKAKAKAEGRLLPEWHPHVKRVKRVGERIAAAAADGAGGGSYEHVKDMEWEFIVVRGSKISYDASTYGFGQVVVNAAVMDRMIDVKEDDCLALLLGREAAHVLAKHPMDELTVDAFFNLPVPTHMTFLVFWETLRLAVTTLSPVTPLTFCLSRKQEADIISMYLAARAGYNLEGSISMLEETCTTKIVDSTDPLRMDAVRLLKRHLPEIRKMYESSGCATS